MSEHKFKIGDRVRWCAGHVDYFDYNNKPVEFGTISDIFGDKAVDVVFNKTDGSSLYCYLTEIELVKETEKGEDNMTEDNNQFVETNKVIKKVINSLDSGGAKMSIEPAGKANVRLTIGAEYRHGGANCFNKRTLQELIHNLQEVCDLLES